ncbi:hypothetical protein BH18VER1_BH18VER1_14850 [soil metagenome]
MVDELVVFVDEHRAAPDLHDKLARLDARVLNTRAPRFFNADFGAMVAACHGDWLLKIDYDEELSAEWDDPRWREILQDTELTHFWCPRRWLTSAQTYIASEPWTPDWQLRLFRNRREEIAFPQQLHETMRMNGPAGYLRTLAIHHHDLRLASRAARELKAAEYERQRPGNGLGFFYLYEDYAPPELPVPGKSAFDPAEEILWMDKLSDADVAQLRVDAEAPAQTLAPRELFWLQAQVTNACARTVGFGTPYPLNLAYHWLDRISGEPVVFDGERTHLVPAVAPRTSAGFRMFVIAPPAPGEYLLRLALVQEHARWLDARSSSTVQDFPVSVTGSS